MRCLAKNGVKITIMEMVGRKGRSRRRSQFLFHERVASKRDLDVVCVSTQVFPFWSKIRLNFLSTDNTRSFFSPVKFAYWSQLMTKIGPFQRSKSLIIRDSYEVGTSVRNTYDSHFPWAGSSAEEAEFSCDSFYSIFLRSHCTLSKTLLRSLRNEWLVKDFDLLFIYGRIWSQREGWKFWAWKDVREKLEETELKKKTDLCPRFN